MANEPSHLSRHGAGVRERVAALLDRAQRTLVWQVWERMLEIEFVDRSVALAGKAFVSFFPLIIVVASFMPESIRDSIFTTLTHRLGIQGEALVSAKQAFASSDDTRRATGVVGLVFTVFFASSFTTALQRVYLRAWRRPPGPAAGTYLRGPAWFLVVLACGALLGALRPLFDEGPQYVVFVLITFVATATLWWFTAWLMLMGQVRWRVLALSAVVTATLLGGFTLSASIWMSGVVTRDEIQFGFFGVGLALTTWFSGAAICILVGACVGAVFAADPGPTGALIRGGDSSLLVEGATPSIPAPSRALGVRGAFGPTEDDADPS